METLKWVVHKAFDGWLLVLPLMWIVFEFWSRLG